MKTTTKTILASFYAILPILVNGAVPIVKSDGSIGWAPEKQDNKQQGGAPIVNPDGSIGWPGKSQNSQPKGKDSPNAVAVPVNPSNTNTVAVAVPVTPPAQPANNPQPQPQKQDAPPSTTATLTPTLKPGEPVKEAALDPTPAPPPPGGCPAEGKGVMTWRINNNYGIPLSVSYLNNADSPSAIGCPGAAQMTPSQTTDIVFPTGWAGRVIVGKEAKDGASLIEGSTTGWNDIDVSYVDGYSVPITCSNQKEVLTGCNIDLWKTGSCPNAAGDNSICHNPAASSPNGPATPFFLPCQGAAYTFPNDNIANSGNTQSELVTCCIGTEEQGCKGPERQGKGDNKPSKRELGAPRYLPTKRHAHAMRHIRKAAIGAHK